MTVRTLSLNEANQIITALATSDGRNDAIQTLIARISDANEAAIEDFEECDCGSSIHTPVDGFWSDDDEPIIFIDLSEDDDCLIEGTTPSPSQTDRVRKEPYNDRLL